MRKLNKSARYESDDKNQKDHNVTVVNEEHIGPSISNEDQPRTSQNQPDQNEPTPPEPKQDQQQQQQTQEAGPSQNEPAPERPQINSIQANGNPFQPTSTATKFSIMTKLLKKQNRIHNATENQEHNEFMQKYGVNQSRAQITDGNEQPEIRGFFKKLKYYLTNYVIDASQDKYYYWTIIVTMAYAYNLVFVIARQVFTDMMGPVGERMCLLSKDDVNTTVPCTNLLLVNMTQMPTIELYSDMGWSRYWWIRFGWGVVDVFMDLIYLFDMFVRTRTGYLEQGLVVKDVAKIKKLYYASKQFKYDIASIIPIDYLIGWQWPFTWFTPFPIARLNRLLRKNRVTDCMERTETRSSMPNAFRVMVVVWYIIIIIHWNGCLYFWISEAIGLGTDGWVYGYQNKQSLPDDVKDDLLRRYIYSFYWSTLILTTIGEVPGPVRNVEFLFVTLDLMCGVLIFATIVGNVGSMISNMSAARTEFQNKMDGIKQYMELRKVSKQLEMRVIKWFDYLWANKQSLSDQQVLRVLPDKLQAEIAMQVHFETLRKVRIFQDCEAGLLAELVLKLQLQVFSPGDYICRKGDIGREMYIVKRGRLQVVGDDGQKVFATLSEGAVFGELSILNISGSKNGNRRTANVRSMGYTDLFVLNKNDLWNALREYPDARKLLLAKGRELLRKDNLLDENAPEEQQTAEEQAEQLNGSVRVLQTRLARLIAEHTSTETKLNSRIEYLERQLLK
ncbi:hypothetical protein WR25_08554 isoform B [Diploscapter pachys]|nr:hypothetical protein WR25_08554 isoform B [Diploscapter pachys]